MIVALEVLLAALVFDIVAPIEHQLGVNDAVHLFHEAGGELAELSVVASFVSEVKIADRKAPQAHRPLRGKDERRRSPRAGVQLGRRHRRREPREGPRALRSWPRSHAVKRSFVMSREITIASTLPTTIFSDSGDAPAVRMTHSTTATFISSFWLRTRQRSGALRTLGVSHRGGGRELARRQRTIARGQDLASILGHDQRVLELSRQRAIARDDGPPIFEDVDLVAADVDHRFDREAHPCLEPEPRPAHAHVRDLRRLVKATTDAVPYESTHHRATLTFGELLYGGADVAETGSFAYLRDTEFERAASGLRHVARLFRGLPHVERSRCIAVKPVIDRSHIDVDDVTVFETLRAGDPVAYDLVDGGAHAFREPVIVERRRTGAPSDRVFVHEPVDLVGGDARTNDLPNPQ